MMKSTNLKALSIVFLVALLVGLRSEAIASEDLEGEAAWAESYSALYGDALPDFYVLGDGSFQANWLTDSEEALRPCVVFEHCVWLKVASNQTCPVSGIVRFNVIDGHEKILETRESDPFIVLPGEMAFIELGSKMLDESSFVEPVDAFCADLLPAV